MSDEVGAVFAEWEDPIDRGRSLCLGGREWEEPDHGWEGPVDPTCAVRLQQLGQRAALGR